MNEVAPSRADRRLPRGVLRSLVLSAAVLLLAQGMCLAKGADRPPEILSWRHVVLPRETYESLATEWQAYLQKHPRDAFAWVQWGNALKYSGKPEEAAKKYKRAHKVDSRNVVAIEAKVAADISGMDEGSDWEKPRKKLIRATELDPDYPVTYYTLWRVALLQGDDYEAKRCLRRIVETGDMPRPLFDYGCNMVAGAPKDAIILTNGDNDTYPPLAYQTITGDRPDVTIVNVSLLNLKAYVRHVQREGVPTGLSDEEIGQLQHAEGKVISAQVQESMFDSLRTAGWPRPLFYSVTVSESNRALSGRTVLEGILQRISVVDTIDAPDIDLPRTRELFETVYRLEGMTDPLIDWERESSVAHLGTNYTKVLTDLGKGLISSGSSEDGDRQLFRAVNILAFHGERKEVDELLAWWSAETPRSEYLAKARALEVKRP